MQTFDDVMFMFGVISEISFPIKYKIKNFKKLIKNFKKSGKKCFVAARSSTAPLAANVALMPLNYIKLWLKMHFHEQIVAAKLPTKATGSCHTQPRIVTKGTLTEEESSVQFQLNLT